MFQRSLAAAAVMFAFACPASAQESELAKIREEIKQIKETYERRIEMLEKRLAEAEAKGAAGSERSQPGMEASAGAASGRGGESAFNPAVSLILQGTYASTSQDPESFRITGFMPTGGEVGPPKRSFSLGETELIFTANVDPYFRGVAVAALAPENEVEIEEAYFQTLALPRGFTLKGGRFLSGIGYQNEIHQHAWDFQDAPLPYKAFLGGRLRQEGVQLKWLAPTPVFLEFGAELSSGSGFPGSERNRNGVGGGAIFSHIGGDIGASYAWRAGLSYVKTSPRNRSYEDIDSLGGAVTNRFTGDAKLWIADVVLKWAPDDNPSYRNFKLQGEYFRFRQDGSLTYDDSTGSAVFGSITDRFDSTQSGWYVQGVYQFLPRWRAGYRYDRLRFGSVNNGIVRNGLGPAAADFPLLAPHDPARNTLMLDWSLSEFSRVRLQYAVDRSRLGATDNQFFVQYIHSLGAHGAHRF